MLASAKGLQRGVPPGGAGSVSGSKQLLVADISQGVNWLSRSCTLQAWKCACSLSKSKLVFQRRVGPPNLACWVGGKHVIERLHAHFQLGSVKSPGRDFVDEVLDIPGRGSVRYRQPFGQFSNPNPHIAPGLALSFLFPPSPLFLRV